MAFETFTCFRWFTCTLIINSLFFLCLQKGTEICNYSYPNTILAVRLNRVVSMQILLLSSIARGVDQFYLDKKILSLFSVYSVAQWTLFGSIFQRLLVVLEESLYIHNIRDMKVGEKWYIKLGKEKSIMTYMYQTLLKN